ncbi:serine/threonine protein kinase [Rhodopirellula sp. P2]|uniref:serine/threonine protein kinase n=1 Tax=Rhodopirellula sp. P2 TaxID=2127060 RepID=UPI0023686D23|nr:serine/threonine protein kinase [Rhodopirellula sp. P2]WDQ18912.1 serine/threonine protein kinase [Rhodopirellula sp. P2]
MVQSGLADASVPPIWAADFANDHGGKPPSNPASLASWLVKTRRVEKYPLSRVLKHATWEADFPNTPVLRIAPLTLVAAEKTAPFPFSHWLSVICDSAQNGEKPIAGWLRQIDPAGLPAEAAANLRAHAELTHPALQPIEIIPVRNGPLGDPLGSRRDFAGLFSPLPSGHCLRAPGKPGSVQQTVAGLSSLCDAAIAMHAKGLVHGGIHFDRVWVSESDPWCLLRDPFATLTNFSTQDVTVNHEGWLESLPESRAHWSPERLANASGHVANISDDIFALGCLGFELRYGRPAFNGQTRNALPIELTTAVEQGASGDPLCRVLAAALAIDPNARFASVEQFSQALGVAASATPAAVTPKVEQAVADEPKPAKDVEPVTQPTESKRAATTSTPGPAKPKQAAQPKRPTDLKPTAEIKRSEESSSPKESRQPEEPQQVEEPKQVEKPQPAAVPTKPAEPEQAQPSEEKPAKKTESVSESKAAANDSVRPVAKDPGEAKPNQPSEPAVAAAVVPTRRRRKRRNQKAWYGIYALCIPVLVLVVILATRDKSSQQVAKRVRPPVPQFIPRVSSDTELSSEERQRTAPVRRPAPSGIEVVDSEQMLWAPPDLQIDGAQTSRATGLLPPGPAAVVTMDWQRLRQLGLLEMFGPETQGWLESLNQWSGVPSESISHVALAWFPGSEGVPEVSAAVRLSEPLSLESLLDVWDVSAARGASGETIYAGDTRDALAYFPMSQGRPAEAADDLVDAFAVGSIARIGEVAEMGGAPVVLPRLLEDLWQSARPNDAIAFLTQPNFLVSDARQWMEASSPALIPWIRQNLLADCGGILIRIAATEEAGSYVEVRLATAPGVDPTELATPLREQLHNAPRWAEDFLVTRDIDPSWRLLAARLPSMWAFAQENVRTGRVDRKLVWNAYLPPLALPQLTLATLLATNTTTEPVSEAMASNETKLSIDDMLDRKMSVSFDQESLQFAVDTIAEEFNRDLPEGNQLPPIEIIGGDLQKMGITQNQQIRDFAKSDVPLRTVLTDLVLGANPDRTATGPDDPKQALVWVVKPDKSAILITTRLASDGQYELPSEFVK